MRVEVEERQGELAAIVYGDGLPVVLALAPNAIEQGVPDRFDRLARDQGSYTRVEQQTAAGREVWGVAARGPQGAAWLAVPGFQGGNLGYRAARAAREQIELLRAREIPV